LSFTCIRIQATLFIQVLHKFKGFAFINLFYNIYGNLYATKK
jgi:hypothetical protein